MNTLIKTLVTSSVLASTLLVSAADRNPRDISENLVRNAQRTYELINREADYLTRRQINQVNQKLDEIRDIVRNGGSLPVPPNPPPYTPPPAPKFNIRGKIETSEFSFDVIDLRNLLIQCSAFVVQRNLLQVDEIQVSVNFKPIQKLYNSQTYWKSSVETCMQVVEVARKEAVPNFNGLDTVFGTIETTEFLFSGNGKAELFRQCEDFVNSKGLIQVDEIKTVTNLNPIKSLYNGQTYWRGAFEVCTQVLKDLP
jgi:hypothetical protein